MPAEIDTGGPTVLHCDYRADCPIPIVLSAFARDYATRSQSSPATTHDRKVDGLNHPADERRNRRDSYCRKREESHCRKREKILVDSRTYHHLPSELREILDRRALPLPGQRESSPGESGEYHVERDYLKAETKVEPRSFAIYHRRLSFVDASDESTSLDDRPRFGPVRSNHDSSGTRTSSLENPGRIDTSETRQARRGSSLLSSHRSRTVPQRRSSQRRRNHEERRVAIVETHPEYARRSRSSRLDLGVDESRSIDHCRDLTAIYRPRKSWNKSDPSSERKRRSYVSLALVLLLALFGQNGLLNARVLNSGARLTLFAIGTVINVASGAPIDLIGDAGIRAERSANLSHISGVSRKIQMYIKNRHLQILPDGTANGTYDDTSDYTIFQRTSVSRGQVRIQGVATCLYLCMDSCGLLYGSRDYTEDCVFNETLEEHNYNTYSSIRWSTAKKTLYLGLNRRGQPRRVQAKGHILGRLSTYARVLPRMVPPDRVEALQRRMLGAEHNVRHRHSSPAHHHHRAESGAPQTICPNLPPQEKDGRDRFRCRKRKKRKKKKRRCKPGEEPGPQCEISEETTAPPSSLTTQRVTTKRVTTERVTAERVTTERVITVSTVKPTRNYDNGTALESKRPCESAASEEACRREALSASSKKRKSRIDDQRRDTTKVPPNGQVPRGEGRGTNKAKNTPDTGGTRGKNEGKGGQGTKKQKPRAEGQKNPSTGQPRNRGKKKTEAAIDEALYQDCWYPGEGDYDEDYQVDRINGKNKAHEARSSAKKPKIVVGNDSQSKKPDLTDGKKKKRKGTGPRGNGSLSSQRQKQSTTRKRFASGDPKDRRNVGSAATVTTARPSTDSSSSWPRSGVSNGQSSAPREKLPSHRRKVKTSSSPKNDVTTSTSDGSIVTNLFVGARKGKTSSSDILSSSSRPTNATFVAIPSTTPTDRESIIKLSVPPSNRLSSLASFSSTAVSVLENESNSSGALLESSAASAMEDDEQEDEEDDDEDGDRSSLFFNDYTTANDSSILDSFEDTAGSSTVDTVAHDGTSVECIEDEDGDIPFDPSKAPLLASTAKTRADGLAM